ncbi:sulfotransferase [candidate division KSB1 bacterium]|nr:sulfotransferase [candidate division KSB1 bacterium]
MAMITVIGRGHSGTRAMSHTLSASGVFMGAPLNASGDLLPPEAMYDACRIFARYVEREGELEWNWNAVQQMDIPSEFTQLVQSYLISVRQDKSAHKGWKIPETTLAFPWIARLFPDIKYIFWIRDPRDSIIGSHLTDDLRDFGVEYPPTADERLRRAISWKYQYDLVKATPKPKYWIEVRFEDFVLRQVQTLARLEDFLGIKLARIPVNREAVGRWKSDEGINYFDFFAPAMAVYGYERREPHHA